MPFRDRASQSDMKPVRRNAGARVAEVAPVQSLQQPPREPEAEPDDGLDEVAARAEEAADAEAGFVPEFQPPEEDRPTLEEYRERWAEKLAWHSRGVPGPFALLPLTWADQDLPRPLP